MGKRACPSLASKPPETASWAISSVPTPVERRGSATWTGIEIYNASNNAVGAETPVPGTGPGNVISGNSNAGVEIASGNGQTGAFNNRIFGNIIGLNASGTAAVANGSQGVAILDAFDNVVGSAGLTTSRNVISANRGDGVLIRESSDGSDTVTVTGVNDSPTSAEVFIQARVRDRGGRQ